MYDMRLVGVLCDRLPSTLDLLLRLDCKHDSTSRCLALTHQSSATMSTP
jgi:hypothetical protein